LAAAFLLITAAIFLLSREHLRAATFLSLAAWLVLGFFAASIAQKPKPKNYVLNVLNSRRTRFARAASLARHTPRRTGQRCRGESGRKSNWSALTIRSARFPPRAA
jgi:hypothetical protein